SAAVANGLNGILVDAGASAVQIGDRLPGEGNLISGNKRDGIRVTGGASQVTIEENTIGLNLTGTAAVGNEQSGIAIVGAGTHTVNVGTGNFGNVISGNVQNGIKVNAAKTVTITANKIGTTPAGTAGVGNGGNGIDLEGATNVFIGPKNQEVNTIAGNQVGVRVASSTQTEVRSNVISGNGVGIQVDSSSTKTDVERNIIGLS